MAGAGCRLSRGSGTRTSPPERTLYAALALPFATSVEFALPSNRNSTKFASRGLPPEAIRGEMVHTGVTMSVELDESSSVFLLRAVASGRYISTSEVVTAGLSLLETHENQLTELRDALATGEASGPAEEFSFDRFVASKAL